MANSLLPSTSPKVRNWLVINPVLLFTTPYFILLEWRLLELLVTMPAYAAVLARLLLSFMGFLLLMDIIMVLGTVVLFWMAEVLVLSGDC